MKHIVTGLFKYLCPIESVYRLSLCACIRRLLISLYNFTNHYCPQTLQLVTKLTRDFHICWLLTFIFTIRSFCTHNKNRAVVYMVDF